MEFSSTTFFPPSSVCHTNIHVVMDDSCTDGTKLQRGLTGVHTRLTSNREQSRGTGRAAVSLPSPRRDCRDATWDNSAQFPPFSHEQPNGFAWLCTHKSPLQREFPSSNLIKHNRQHRLIFVASQLPDVSTYFL